MYLAWLPSDRIQISLYTGNLRLHGTVPEAKQKKVVNFNQSASLQLATETNFLKSNPLLWEQNTFWKGSRSIDYHEPNPSYPLLLASGKQR